MDDDEGNRGMEPREDLGEYTTLIVRIRQDDAGRLSGVLERVRTGEKPRFHGLETLAHRMDKRARAAAIRVAASLAAPA